ncbi:MAG: RagB/SusD family nutrient uptake outer membrane protein [Sphingobacteriales bacterium]|nr:RagB/SusD family nutrient uptake outer membrane protein [Sphingobacteriales bacterium]OJY83568.1 MAG: hypothetical protein BGP14_09920 [Sphingobacteriales bacterium 44-15]
MKTSVIIYTVLTINVLLCLSCKKNILDTEPFDKFDENTVWNSRATADAFINGAYASILGVYSTSPSHVQFDAYTTNSVVNAAGNGSNVALETFDRYSDFGFNRFSNIRRCNLVLNKAPSSAGLTDSDKKELVAEARFLKAMAYFDLARKFGRVMWIDTLLTPDDNFKLPLTSSVGETYDKIIQLLDAAIPGLPKTAKAGKASCYAALALKSEVALQAAAYTGNDAYYDKAIAAADTIINSGKYSMESDYEGMFNETKKNSPEIIFAIYRSKVNTNCENISDLQNVMPNTNNGAVAARGGYPFFKVDGIFLGWTWWGVSQNLVDDYLVIDQSDPLKAVKWNETSQFTNNVTRISPASSIIEDTGRLTGNSDVSALMYQHRDKRFYASVVYDSCTWFGESISMKVKGNLYRLTNGALGPHMSPSNYLWRKGVYNVSPRVAAGVPTDYHWVVFRLGRVYLNKAEALLRQGKIAEAVQSLNVTRTVHGQLPPSTAGSATEAWIDYKRERRVDLAKEFDYYWSLLRWGKYGGDANHGIAPSGDIPELTEPATFIEINENRTGYSVQHLVFLNQNQRKFTANRRYLFPIPQGQIERNEMLAQNENW